MRDAIASIAKRGDELVLPLAEEKTELISLKITSVQLMPGWVVWLYWISKA